MTMITLTQFQLESRIAYQERLIKYYQAQIVTFTNYKQFHVSRIDALLNRPNNSAAYIQRMNKYKEWIIGRYDLQIQRLQSLIEKANKAIEDLKALLPGINPISNAVLKEIVDVTKTVHDSMMTYLKNNWNHYPESDEYQDGNNFFIPFVPKNYNLRIESAPGMLLDPPPPSNWYNCEVSSLGSSKSGSKWYRNTYLEVYGYFTAVNKDKNNGELLTFRTDNASLVSTGIYYVKQVYIPPTGLTQDDAKTINIEYDPKFKPIILYNKLTSVLDRTAIDAIYYAVENLCNWAKNTAFLVPPQICVDRYYFDRYGWSVKVPSQTPIVAPLLNPSDTVCSTVFDPYCDLITDKTYFNECEANKGNALYKEQGACGFMVWARSRTNKAIPQNPTPAITDSGLPLVDTSGNTVVLPNILQAEYFSRLYYFLAHSYRNKKVNSLSALGTWAINHLQSYTTNPNL